MINRQKNGRRTQRQGEMTAHAKLYLRSASPEQRWAGQWATMSMLYRNTFSDESTFVKIYKSGRPVSWQPETPVLSFFQFRNDLYYKEYGV